MTEIRSSDLETGLSSSDDRVVSEATSVSTPCKAWNISCSLSEKDEKRIRDRFQFPDSVKIRIPSDEERTYHSYADEICFYEADFTSGLRFPIHPFVREPFFLFASCSDTVGAKLLANPCLLYGGMDVHQ